MCRALSREGRRDQYLRPLPPLSFRHSRTRFDPRTTRGILIAPAIRLLRKKKKKKPDRPLSAVPVVRRVHLTGTRRTAVYSSNIPRIPASASALPDRETSWSEEMYSFFSANETFFGFSTFVRARATKNYGCGTTTIPKRSDRNILSNYRSTL